MKHFYTDPQGNQFEWETADPPQPAFDAVGALATLLAVLEIISLEDAANSIGKTTDELILEAQAWAVAANSQ